MSSGRFKLIYFIFKRDSLFMNKNCFSNFVCIIQHFRCSNHFEHDKNSFLLNIIKLPYHIYIVIGLFFYVLLCFFTYIYIILLNFFYLYYFIFFITYFF